MTAGIKQKVAFAEICDAWSETLKEMDLSAPVPIAAILSSDESEIHEVIKHRVPDIDMIGV